MHFKHPLHLFCQNTIICFRLEKVQSTSRQLRCLCTFQSPSALHHSPPILSTTKRQGKAERCIIHKPRLLNKICFTNKITHTLLLQDQRPKKGINSSFTFSPNLTCHANGTGGKMKPKNLPAPLLPLNYQTICSFKEILASTAQHLYLIKT